MEGDIRPWLQSKVDKTLRKEEMREERKGKSGSKRRREGIRLDNLKKFQHIYIYIC